MNTKATADSHKKKKSARRLLLLLFVFVCLILSSRHYIRQDKELKRLRMEADDLERQLDDAKHQSDRLKDMEQMVGSPDFIERIARDELGLVRPDEIIFIH